VTTDRDRALVVEDLTIRLRDAPGSSSGVLVDRVSLDLRAGRTTGLVGESGSGKSMTALALLGLLPPGVETSGGTATLVDGTDVLRLSPSEVSRVRGPRIAMVFQDPMSSLDPAYSIGYQIAETLRRHGRMTRRQAQDRAANLLDLVGIQDARRRLGAYPHMLSGGMRQRVLIAIALANEPEVLIADEPTTALDVTTQAQILGLLRRLREVLTPRRGGGPGPGPAVRLWVYHVGNTGSTPICSR
jgi:ABC-type microcin C transport system duplicated ATPase subunit YejF